MARILKPLVRGGGWYPSKKWIPLVKNGGYTTQNGGETEPVWATASGAIASFTTPFAYPLKKLVAQINPVQDLHGYANPWPAGGGANKLDPSAVFDNTSYYTINSNGTVTVTASDGRGWASITSVLSLPAGTYTIAKTPTTGTSDIRLSTEEYATGHVFTSQISFTLSEAGTVKIKMAYSGVTYPQTYNVQIVSGTTVPTWSPYANECPISGHTGLSVEVKGKNLLNLVESEMISYGYGRLFPFKFKSGITYTISCQKVFGGTGTKGMRVVAMDESYNLIGNPFSSYAFGNAELHSTFTPTVEQEKAVYLGLQANSNGMTYATIIDAGLMIEVGSSASSYEPYTSGTTTTISWQDEAGTVYGGTATYNGDGTWTLVAEGILIELDGTEQGWTKYSTQTCYNQNIAKLTQYNSGELYGYCSHVGRNSAGVIDNTILGHAYSGNGLEFKKLIDYWGLQDNEPETWKAYLAAQKSAGTPIQIVAYLQTPQTYTITTGELIETLYGQNNVWVDTGSVEVTYRIG